jgi:hypothetical protein
VLNVKLGPGHEEINIRFLEAEIFFDRFLGDDGNTNECPTKLA